MVMMAYLCLLDVLAEFGEATQGIVQCHNVGTGLLRQASRVGTATGSAVSAIVQGDCDDDLQDCCV